MRASPLLRFRALPVNAFNWSCAAGCTRMPTLGSTSHLGSSLASRQWSSTSSSLGSSSCLSSSDPSKSEISIKLMLTLHAVVPSGEYHKRNLDSTLHWIGRVASSEPLGEQSRALTVEWSYRANIYITIKSSPRYTIDPEDRSLSQVWPEPSPLTSLHYITSHHIHIASRGVDLFLGLGGTDFSALTRRKIFFQLPLQFWNFGGRIIF